MDWQLIRYENMEKALKAKFRQDIEAVESGKSMPKLKPLEPTISEPMTATFRRIIRMEEKTGKTDEDILEAIL